MTLYRMTAQVLHYALLRQIWYFTKTRIFNSVSNHYYNKNGRTEPIRTVDLSPPRGTSQPYFNSETFACLIPSHTQNFNSINILSLFWDNSETNKILPQICMEARPVRFNKTNSLTKILCQGQRPKNSNPIHKIIPRSLGVNNE